MLRVLAVLLALAWWSPRVARGETAAHVVVLKDGSLVASRTKPLCAFGQVRYTDESGRLQVLPDSKVDVRATRAHPSNAASSAAPARAGLNVLGDGDVPDMPRAQAGGGRPAVTVYSATWCPHCSRLKSWLDANGIAANVIEVDTLPKDKQAAVHRQVAALTGGRVAFPTVVIGSAVKAGFDPAWMSARLKPKSGSAAGAKQR